METKSRQPRNHKKLWTHEEEQDLLDMYGIYSFLYLTRYFGRTTLAIKEKFNALTGVRDTSTTEGSITIAQLSEAIGVTDRTILNWIKHLKLPATQIHKQRSDTRRRIYYINPELFWDWAKLHKDRIPFFKLKRDLLHPEPKWLENEMRSFKQNNISIKTNTSWSEEEDELAWYLWKNGVNYRKIAQKLGRPEKGTQRRLTIIKKRKEGINHDKNL
ncbi:hypothetical protein NST86_33370 [Bacillus sp. FSL L8-0199]|uniref:MerR family transcriptional regulator n=1 Tax=Bacillus sp. FSL L8-0199 TaxID=2954616 RepID=UPI0030FC7191